MPKQKWSQFEITLLMLVYPELTIQELKIAFPGRSQQSINSMVRRLRESGEFTAVKAQRAINRAKWQRHPEDRRRWAGRSWSKKSEQVLKVLYPHTTIKELLDVFPGETQKSLNSKIGRLKRQGEITGNKTEAAVERARRQRTWSRQLRPEVYNVEPEEWRNR